MVGEGWVTTSMTFRLISSWEDDPGLGLFDEANGICLGYTCSLQVEEEKQVVSDLKTFPLAGTRTRLGEGRLPSDRDVEADLGLPCPGGLLQLPFQPGSASWRGRHSVSPSRLLPAPDPRSWWGWPGRGGSGGGGCGAPEQRRGVRHVGPCSRRARCFPRCLTEPCSVSIVPPHG